MAKINVAVVGVGNVTSVLVQALQHYGEDDSRPGIWHRVVGGYRMGDIRVVAAFDSEPSKIGMDLSEAVFAKPNVARKFLELQPRDVRVEEGILGENSNGADRVRDLLRSGQVDMVINLLPSGLDAVSLRYARIALESGCSFVNATPAPISIDPHLEEAFKGRRLVCAGDDLMSQMGGTAFHRGILHLMDARGVKVLRSYQLDVGGGAETLNTVDEKVRAIKREVKTGSVSYELPYSFDRVTGTTDYVDFMGNDRTSYFWIEGEGLLDTGVKIDIYLRTNDGANAGNILLDVIRAVKSAQSRGMWGCPSSICSYGFKRPPMPLKIDEAYQAFANAFLI